MRHTGESAVDNEDVTRFAPSVMRPANKYMAKTIAIGV